MTEIKEEFKKSIISARPAFNRNISLSLTNLSALPMASGTRVLRVIREVSSGVNGAQSGNGIGSMAQQRIDEREKEKLEMQHLNDKLAAFIEKVRFLDAQNRILSTEKEKLESFFDKERVSHTLFETEITGAQEIIEDMKKSNSGQEEELSTLEKELVSQQERLDSAKKDREGDRETLDKLLVDYSEKEAEINLLKRRIALLEDNIGHVKKNNNDLTRLLTETRHQIDKENILCLQDRTQVEALKEQIKFIIDSYDDELRHLLAQAARDTTGENKEFFRSELSNAMREIRDEHERNSDAHRMEMETMYQRQIQEIETQSAKQNIEHNHQQTETKKLKDLVTTLRTKLTDLQGRNAFLEKQVEEMNYQIEDDQRMFEGELNDKDKRIRSARDERDSTMLEYQMTIDKIQNNKGEIEVFRNMLEGEGAGLKQLVENVVKTTNMNEVVDTETMRVVKGESTSRSTNSRAAKGNVSIKDVCPAAAFILLENTHRKKDEKMGNWKLKRKIDGKSEVVYTFPEDYVLRAGQSVKIATKSAPVDENENTLMFDGSSFGSGASMYTFLYNADGEERASMVQRQVDSEVREETTA